MSQRRQQRRAKQVRRTNVRAAQRAKRPPTPADIALRAVRDHAVPLASRDPLDAELVASILMAVGWEHVLEAPADIANELPHPALPVISLLRNLRVEPGELADAALALAHALTAADRQDPQVVAASGVLVEQLREAGAQDPIWAGETARYELATAHDVRDVWMDQHQLLLEFVDGEGRAHGLMLMIDRGDGFQVVELEVVDEPAALLAEVRASIESSEDAPLMRIDELSPARAGGMLAAAIEGTFDAHGDVLVERGDAELLQVLLAREELLEPIAKANWDEANATPFDSDLAELSVEELHERFEASGQLTDSGDASVEAVVRLMDWVHLLAYPRALFGPVQVEEVLLDHVPRALRGAELDDAALAATVEATIASVRAWALYCARLVELDDAAVADVLAAIDHYAPLHEQALLEPVAAGA